MLEGRVVANHVDEHQASFSILGSGDTPYEVIYNNGWMCNCPAYTSECAHIYACQKITLFEPGRKLTFSSKDDELTKLLNGG